MQCMLGSKCYYPDKLTMFLSNLIKSRKEERFSQVINPSYKTELTIMSCECDWVI